jgi:hypothetical protein
MNDTDISEIVIARIIHLINEWEVIDPDKMTISFMRLLEVYDDIGFNMPYDRDVLGSEYGYYRVID